MTERIRILCLANKRLPDSDYRVQFGKKSELAEVIYALPEKPPGVSDEQFTRVGFAEGLSTSDVWHFFKLFWWLRSLRNEIDLVHFFSTKLQLWGPLVARLAGVRCVSTITGYGRTFCREELSTRLLRPIYLLFMRLSLQLAEVSFFQNRKDRAWLCERFPQFAKKMLWIGSGVGADLVQEKGFAERPLRVLFVGRIMNDKGVRLVLEVARQMTGEMKFTLVGPLAPGEESLNSEVREAERDGYVKYLGELGTQQLAREYRRHHVFLFPTRYGEGMPRVMLEAGFARLCPVASTIRAHADLIDTGRGFSIDTTDELTSIILTLRRLCVNRKELEQNARSYQQHIVNNYSVNEYVKRMDAHLLRLFPERQDTHQLIDLRRGTIDDIDDIVNVHRLAFPGFFMTRLGTRFLREYYQCVLTDWRGLVSVACRSDGQIVGFAAGFLDPPRFYQRLRQFRIRLLLSAIPGLLRAPWLLFRMAGTSRRATDASRLADQMNSAELASLAVLPQVQAAGVGHRLNYAFLKMSKEVGAAVVQLTTDAHGNDAVNRFYERQGYELVETLNASGPRPMNLYRCLVSSTPVQQAA